MLRLQEIPEVTFCGCRIFLGTTDVGDNFMPIEHVCHTFRDAFSDTILDKSKLTQHPKKKKEG